MTLKQMARKGGSAKSAAKAESSRRNGRNGGRKMLPFLCPQCGGSYFGRDTGPAPDGTVAVLRTVRCHTPKCGWRGQWPPKRSRKRDAAVPPYPGTIGAPPLSTSEYHFCYDIVL